MPVSCFGSLHNCAVANLRIATSPQFCLTAARIARLELQTGEVFPVDFPCEALCPLRSIEKKLRTTVDTEVHRGTTEVHRRTFAGEPWISQSASGTIAIYN